MIRPGLHPPWQVTWLPCRPWNLRIGITNAADRNVIAPCRIRGEGISFPSMPCIFASQYRPLLIHTIAPVTPIRA